MYQETLTKDELVKKDPFGRPSTDNKREGGIIDISANLQTVLKGSAMGGFIKYYAAALCSNQPVVRHFKIILF